MGCSLSYLNDAHLHCTGKLSAGEYRIDGGVSSQFITGLLFAGALMPGMTRITVTGKLESKPYIDMTLDTLNMFGCSCQDYTIIGGEKLHTPGSIQVEGDWSNGAFFLAANTLGCSISIDNLSMESLQGDRRAASLLPQLNENCTISAADIPDLVPILSIVAACNRGAVFTDIQRLRLKESDRVKSIVDMLRSLGGQAEATESTLIVSGTGLRGGTVNSVNDHRIAMAAAIAATACVDDVTVLGAECVEKSCPKFFDEYRRLGGNYEQYLR